MKTVNREEGQKESYRSFTEVYVVPRTERYI